MTNIIIIQNYLSLLQKLIDERNQFGELSQDEESDRADELMSWWQQMTEEEQAITENEIELIKLTK